MLRYDTFQKANNKGADQSARMHKLVCAFVVPKPRRLFFSRQGPNYIVTGKILVKASADVKTYILFQLPQIILNLNIYDNRECIITRDNQIK